MIDRFLFIHDIKNHLRTIEGLAASSQVTQITDYIANLEATISPSEHARLCTDPILNLILIRVSEECKVKGITLHLDVRDNCTSFLDAPSITTLFGNLLSNAVEAACVSNEKLIELSVIRNVQQSNILVSVINACDTAPIPDRNGRFQTRKQTGIHGIGLNSIDRVVRKYNGISTMYFDKDEKKFHHIIHFPI